MQIIVRRVEHLDTINIDILPYIYDNTESESELRKPMVLLASVYLDDGKLRNSRSKNLPHDFLLEVMQGPQERRQRYHKCDEHWPEKNAKDIFVAEERQGNVSLRTAGKVILSLMEVGFVIAAYALLLTSRRLV